MPELHPLLATRWSPRAFDRIAEVTPAEMASLIEAARWSPSSANSQPWRFVVGLRDQETHKRIFTNLDHDDQRWAADASALILATHLTTGPSGEPLRLAPYDLGQSVAYLCVQASALGLYTHQIAGFDTASMRADLDLPADLALAVVIAVGRLGNPDHLPPDLRDRELGLRVRHPAHELHIAVV
jgi:nitroreductase